MDRIRICEIARDNFGGGDGRAINKHSVRTYLTPDGRLYELDRTLDMAPPAFCINGPAHPGHVGLVPRIPVEGKEFWGDGKGWPTAEKVLCGYLKADLIDTRLFLRTYGVVVEDTAKREVYTFRDLTFTATFQHDPSDRSKTGWNVHVTLHNGLNCNTFEKT